jgi:hypothetical protein
MAKKQKCPKCGKQTFGESGEVLECSSCGTVGWLGAGPTNIGQPGATCKVGDTRTMKLVATLNN